MKCLCSKKQLKTCQQIYASNITVCVYCAIWYLNKWHYNPKPNSAFQLVICRCNFWGSIEWCIKKRGRKSTNETKHNVKVPLPWTFLPESHQTDSHPQWRLFHNGDSDSYRARAPELTYCAFNEKINICMKVEQQKLSYFDWSTYKCRWTYHPVCLVQVLWFVTVTWSFLWTKKTHKGNSKSHLQPWFRWQKVFVSFKFLADFVHVRDSDIPKTTWNRSYCISHLWNNKHAHWASAVLCVDWIRSEISQCDQGRDRVRLKDLRLHLPMNIWCLSEARAGDPLSGPGGVRGNLPYLHLATFQQFLVRMWRHIPVLPGSYAAAVFASNENVFFSS